MIFIDNRTGSKDLPTFPSISRHPHELLTLDSGDVHFIGNGPDDQPLLIGIELKSLADLIQSSSTGRLQTQLKGMLDYYDISYLLYYGLYRAAPRDGLLQLRVGNQWRRYKLGKRSAPWTYLEATLLSVSSTGVRIKHTSTKTEAADWISACYSWWQKPWDKHKLFRKLDRSQEVSSMPGMDGDLELRTRLASALPMMGFERAYAAARHFPTVYSMLTASEEDWCEVDGIGKGVARAAVEVLSR